MLAFLGFVGVLPRLVDTWKWAKELWGAHKAKKAKGKGKDEEEGSKDEWVLTLAAWDALAKRVGDLEKAKRGSGTSVGSSSSVAPQIQSGPAERPAHRHVE